MDEAARKPLAGGLVWNLGSALLPLFASFLVSLLLFPHLGKVGTGHYILVMSAATFFLIVAKFGVHAATSRLVSEHTEQAGPWIRAGLAVRAWFTVPVAALALLLSPWLARTIDGPALVDPFWMVAPVLVAASSYELAGEILVGLSRPRSLFSMRLVFLVLRVIAVLVVRSAGWGVVAFLIGHVLAQMISSGGVWRSLLRDHPAAESGFDSAQARRRVLEISLPLALSSASFLIYAQTDKLMVGWLRDSATAGEFGVARTVLDAALFPTFAIAWTLRPALIRAVREGDDAAIRSRLGEALGWSLIYALGGSALLLFLGPPLLVALFTEEFAGSAPLLAWMTPILFLRGLGTVVFPALLATDRQSTYARLMVLTAALNLVANLLLIPRYGALGAVFATVASLLPLTLGGLLQVHRILGLPRPFAGGANSNSA